MRVGPTRNQPGIRQAWRPRCASKQSPKRWTPFLRCKPEALRNVVRKTMEGGGNCSFVAGGIRLLVCRITAGELAALCPSRRETQRLFFRAGRRCANLSGCDAGPASQAFQSRQPDATRPDPVALLLLGVDSRKLGAKTGGAASCRNFGRTDDHRNGEFSRRRAGFDCSILEAAPDDLE